MFPKKNHLHPRPQSSSPPPTLACAQVVFEEEVEAVSAPRMAGDVDVFASGSVGSYAFDVVGSEDPTAMIFWLRDHKYRVTEDMEPLIERRIRVGLKG